MTDPIPCIEPEVPGRNGRDGLLLRVPYREDFVVALKADLPAPHRYWDAGIGAWWIDEREAGRLAKIVLDHFPTLFMLGGLGEEDRVFHRSAGSAQIGHLRSITREVP